MNHARQFFWQTLQRLRGTKPKKHRFQVAIEQYLERWQKFPGARQAPVQRGGVGIVLMPWLQTAVPLYSIECARQLAARGVPVTLIWDPTNLFDCAPSAWEIEQLERVITAIRSEFEVVSISTAKEDASGAFAFFPELLAENAVQKQRGEDGVAELLAQNPALERDMRAHVAKVHGLLRERQFDWLYLPGGVWAVSGVYASVATEMGLSITTYDSGPGSLFIGHDGVAAHFCDVAKVTNEVLAETENDPAERRRMSEAAQRQMSIRMRGDDEYRLQPVASSEAVRHEWDIIVPLNLRWDSAALCRQRLFASVGDWLRQLLTWAEKHPTARIAIRQHPCEKLADFRGTDDFSQLLAQFPGLKGRAIYFSAQDEVNTYDLIAGAKAILPFTSRVGIEAVMLGKPVILGTQCYYGTCGFTANPETVAEYFANLDDALAGRLTVSERDRERARVTYYLAEYCLELKTSFTPAPPDYPQWVSEPPQKIWGEPANEDLLESFISRESLVRVRYRRLAAGAAR